MAIWKRRSKSGSRAAADRGRELPVSSSIEQLLMNALERGDESLQTGRYLMTFREGADAEGSKSLQDQGMRIANARDFEGQSVSPEDVGDADALVFPEIGVALVSGPAVEARGLAAQEELAAEGPVEVVDPNISCSPTIPSTCVASQAQ